MSHHHYQETRRKCIECWVAENAAGIANLFTDDCFMLSPDNPIAMGKAGVQAFLPWYMKGLNRGSLLCTTLIAVLCTTICPSARGDSIPFTTTVTSQDARNGDTTSGTLVGQANVTTAYSGDVYDSATGAMATYAVYVDTASFFGVQLLPSGEIQVGKLNSSGELGGHDGILVAGTVTFSLTINAAPGAPPAASIPFLFMPQLIVQCETQTKGTGTDTLTSECEAAASASITNDSTGASQSKSISVTGTANNAQYPALAINASPGDTFTIELDTSVGMHGGYFVCGSPGNEVSCGHVHSLATADVDPLLQFDQQTFNQQMGASSYNLSQYYSFSVSSNIPVQTPSITNENAASFAAGPLAPDSFATVFGANLATVTQAIPIPYPPTFGGTTVTFTDSQGVARQAPLEYVSPGQVNYLVPDGTALGQATVTVTSGQASYSQAVPIATIDPGIFIFQGTNLVAANVDVVSGGTQTYENVYSIDSSGALVPAPIDVSQPNTAVYLIIYGTGLRGHSSAANSVTVTAEGTNLTVAYAGAQGQYPGLDQVNVLLPPSLAGMGDVMIQVTVDGQVANPGHVTIQ